MIGHFKTSFLFKLVFLVLTWDSHFFYSAGIYLEVTKTKKDIVSDCTQILILSSISLILGLF